MVDVFDCGVGCGVDEVSSGLQTVDRGVSVPVFVWAGLNNVALLWRDRLDVSRIGGGVVGEGSLAEGSLDVFETVAEALEEQRAERVFTEFVYEYGLFEISGLLNDMGDERCWVIGYCRCCDVKWSYWEDTVCWMCGEVGYLYTPRNIRSLRKYGRQ